ncbi:MAG: 4Fe-4S dicluster domain-containing protein, partial [Lentisphaeria bacterium]|nr:4Fe-4S dicluster domain-containing protein [Lentisphaeria bacterium]
MRRKERVVSTKPISENPYPEITVVECKACGRCVHACPKGVLFIGKALNQRGYTHVEYKGEGCTGCGNCFYACPEPHTIKVHTGR